MVTSAGIVLYGEILWDPLTLIDKWDNRAAAFFASFAFMLTTLGSNISANSLSAANDMTVLFPRYINIRRGQVICALVGGWGLVPWEILASAQGFLTFMSGYTVFLGPFAGIMVTDVSPLFVFRSLYRISAYLFAKNFADWCSLFSIGWYTTARLTSRQCTTLVVGIGIQPDLYVPYALYGL